MKIRDLARIITLVIKRNTYDDYESLVFDWIIFVCLTTNNLWIKHVQKQPPGVLYEKRSSLKFRKFIRKHLCQSLFLSKVAGLRPATIFKKRLWHRCFPAKFVKFLRTPFLQNTSGRLLLHVVIHVVKKLSCQIVYSIKF